MCEQGVLWKRQFNDGIAALRSRDDFIDTLDNHHGWRLDPYVARLIYTELVSNAMTYGKAPFAIEVDCDKQEIRLRVTDSGAGFGAMPPAPSALSEGGRGLYIVKSVADDVQLEGEPMGTTVTAILPRV